MSDLTLLAPQSSYFGLLNTQSSNGLSNVLQPIQDGVGRNSPLSLSLSGIGISTTMGSGFTIDGTQLIATAAEINNVCNNASFAAFTSALQLPAGTTGQRPGIPVNGEIRYNSTTQSGELYANGTWVTINAGNPSGYFPGSPTYLQDTFAGGTHNVSMGTPMPDVTFRTECTFFGDSIAPSASSGSRLCAFGYQSLMAVSSGSDNSAFGHMSGKSTVAGLGNSFFGSSCGKGNVNGDRNSFFGAQCGALSNGTDNAFFGTSCASILATGDENSFFGSLAAENSDGCSSCSAFGFAALQENEQPRMSAFGALAATTNVSGDNLDAFGYSALHSNIFGNDNAAFAQNSLFSNIDGDFNCAFGLESIYSNTGGNSISAFGYQSLRNASQDSNSAFGYQAGLALNTGLSNSFFGASAGSAGSVSGLTGCTLLGASTTILTGLTNATAIGYQAAATTNNTIVLGKSGTNVGIGISAALFPLHVVGPVLFKGITSGFTGTGVTRTQFGGSTAGVSSLLIDYPVSIVLSGMVNVNVRISVMNTAGTKSGYSSSNAAAFYNGATTASVGTLPTITMTTTAAYTPTASWSISGNNLRLTLTGVAASNEVWVVETDYFSTFSNPA
jgi:hypothetical protein